MADSNKTEQATPHRRDKARKEGTVARSRELPGVLSMAAVGGVLILMIPAAAPHWSKLYREILDCAATQDLDANGPILFWSALEVARWVLPILAAAMAVSLFAGFAQGGISFAPAALTPKPEHFNPAQKLGQIFSPMGLGQLAKSLLPFGVIAWIGVSTITGNWAAIVGSSSMGARNLGGFVGDMAFSFAWKSGLVLLLWSGVDYLLTWRRIENDLKMTKQEVREEHKETDGNPMIKRRVRQAQRAMRRKWSLKAAATATVVITNPTHFAVALRYEADMDAPVVVAKGVDALAQKIKQVAGDAGVMLIENRPLAQALYKTVEVGDSIPAKLYQAVAEILVIVFRAQAELSRAEAARRSRNASGVSTATTPRQATSR